MCPFWVDWALETVQSVLLKICLRLYEWHLLCQVDTESKNDCARQLISPMKVDFRVLEEEKDWSFHLERYYNIAFLKYDFPHSHLCNRPMIPVCRLSSVNVLHCMLDKLLFIPSLTIPLLIIKINCKLLILESVFEIYIHIECTWSFSLI